MILLAVNCAHVRTSFIIIFSSDVGKLLSGTLILKNSKYFIVFGKLFNGCIIFERKTIVCKFGGNFTLSNDLSK